MKARCSNPKHASYRYYGGRGIKVCKRWQVFANFLADMGERPSGTSIDRINNDGDYKFSNCRWATQKEQHSNTATSIRFKGKGLKEWAELRGEKYTTLYMRLRTHGSIYPRRKYVRHDRV